VSGFSFRKLASVGGLSSFIFLSVGFLALEKNKCA
tara:strand:+ start:267 stop:371 length:105 start_codon:yes stop_codon:yes gene_type:complete